MKKISVLALIVLLVSFSCRKKTTDGQNDSTFDKSSMLSNLSENITVPQISLFHQSIVELESAFVDYKNNPVEVKLEVLRNKQIEAYLNWQTISAFDFGPMRDNGLKGQINTYPSDTAQILNNISQGSYNLGSVSNVDACGLSALDFLLFRKSSTSKLSQTEYKQYVEDVIAKLKSEATTLKDAWTGYKATFNASVGTESTSAFSQLVNEFNRDYELAKNAKVGIPIGKQSLGISMPEYFEGRYAGISKELFIKNIEALQNIYNGGSSIGFDDYLIHLEKAELNNTINSLFSQIISSAKNISGTLETATNQENQKLTELYNLLSQQVIHIKTEMTSSFGVLITYQDNDGD